MDPTSTLIMCKFECHGPDALPVAQLSFSFVKVISNPADLPCWESSTWGLSGLGVVWGRPQCQFYYAECDSGVSTGRKFSTVPCDCRWCPGGRPAHISQGCLVQ